MKKIAALLLGLAACAPLETNYKPGVSVTTLNRDQTQCDVAALRDVPVATQVRRLPPQYVPPRRECSKDGKCITTQGYYLPGEIRSYDANAPLRARAAQQCMADKGYARVSIPACPAEVAQAAPQAATVQLPPLTENSCVIRNRDGSIQIVRTAG
ncbi:hypothetical protein ABMC89_03645 [Sulfitobacter sp. HNIBRBA3233]|uniref:hypothetical protein n=1 Tax=Sulfitobacter marinivivus TaxID=3158558 RepID=UPI0032DFC305